MTPLHSSCPDVFLLLEDEEDGESRCRGRGGKDSDCGRVALARVGRDGLRLGEELVRLCLGLLSRGGGV